MDEMNRAEIYQRTVWFSGRVQGVGFRYTTMQIAREFEVSGTVTNLMDGRVHLVVEGESSEVDAFVQEIENQMEGYVRETQSESSFSAPRLRGFKII